MKGVVERIVTKVSADRAGPATAADAVAIEEPLEIRVASDPVAITMRTPGDDARLALGFLLAEGIIQSIADVGSVAHCGRPGDEGFGNVIDVIAAPGVLLDIEKVQASRRGTLTTSACGVCGRRSVDDLLAVCGAVPWGASVDVRVLSASTERLRTAQHNFSRTGGVHAAAALSCEGEVLAAFEDVGRHNAVDKVIGALLSEGLVPSDPSKRLGRGLPPLARDRVPCLLAVSGRASFEIIQKAAVARIPIVASVSAASSLAVDLAHRSQVTLAAFVRSGSFNLYTHPERISGLPGVPSIHTPPR